jgi:hypothetical protein
MTDRGEGRNPPQVLSEAYRSTVRLRVRCPATGAQVVVEPGPTSEPLSGKIPWRFTCSECGEQHEIDLRPRLGPPAPRKRNIDIAFDIDLGELVEGHHVIARGIELLPAGSSCLHYDFVPALANTMNTSRENKDGFWWYWKMCTSDDVGTVYLDRDTGMIDSRAEGEVSWGSRDLDGVIPESASVLTLRFEPPSGWVPPEPWRRVIRVDLRNRQVIED